MSPGGNNSPTKYYKLLGHKFKSLQHAQNDDYTDGDNGFSVNAEDGLRFEILEFDKD